MTYQEARAYLNMAEKYSIVLGLDSIGVLLERLGNPQKKLQFIHIAGTNGKGSVGAYISEILVESGYQVGRFISPVILEYRECIQINGEYISENAVGEYMGMIQEAAQWMVKKGLSHPTVFEMETAMAFLEFLHKGCDYVVLETGLGGRLDVTNIIDSPLCAVITAISLDHMEYLGDTLEEIAREKAGIIKKGTTVVVYDQEKVVMDVMREKCQEVDAIFYPMDFQRISNIEHSLDGIRYDFQLEQEEKPCGIHIGILGENQPYNSALGLETALVLEKLGLAIHKTNILEGMRKATWKGRFEVVRESPLIIVDGAHNEAAAISLGKSIEYYFKDRKLYYIMGVLKDKDYRSILKHTASGAQCIVTITPPNPRGLDSTELAKVASEYINQVVDGKTVENALNYCLNRIGKEDGILIFGSLSFLGEVYQILKNGCHPIS